MAFTKCLLPLAAVVLGSLNVAQAFSPVVTRAPGGDMLAGAVGSWRSAGAVECRRSAAAGVGAALKRRSGRLSGVLKMVATAEAVGTDTAVKEFWTRPRTTNANWGVFFDLESKDSDIWITGIRCGGHSFAKYDEFTRLKLQCFSKEGTGKGAETDKSKWTPAALINDLTMPRVQVGDSRAVYTYIPFAKPVHVKAKSSASFCVHTNKKTGMVVRRKINFGGDNPDPYFAEWQGGVTDECQDFKLLAGLTPGENLFVDVGSAEEMRAFVGVIDFSLKDPAA